MHRLLKSKAHTQTYLLAVLLITLLIFGSYAIRQRSVSATAFACEIPLDISPKLPVDQTNGKPERVNCFAWQTFIAVNWSADRYHRGAPDYLNDPDQFGMPDDRSP